MGKHIQSRSICKGGTYVLCISWCATSLLVMFHPFRLLKPVSVHITWNQLVQKAHQHLSQPRSCGYIQKQNTWDYIRLAMQSSMVNKRLVRPSSVQANSIYSKRMQKEHV